jgi:hypothetical protein
MAGCYAALRTGFISRRRAETAQPHSWTVPASMTNPRLSRERRRVSLAVAFWGATPGHLHTGRPQEVQAIDKIGPVVALTNSAGGWRALLSALKAKGDHMRRIVAYETRASSSRRERGQSPSRARRSVPIPCRWFMKLTKFPIQMVFGDYTDARPIWATSVNVARTFRGIVNRHGGDCEVLLLPDAGLRGSTHIALADLNNEAVADELSRWSHRKGMDKLAGE